MFFFSHGSQIPPRFEEFNDQRKHRGNPFKYVRLCRFSSNLGDVFSFQTQKIPYCLGGGLDRKPTDQPHRGMAGITKIHIISF